MKRRELKAWFHTSLTTAANEAWRTLNAKLQGHYRYYGINDNWPTLMAFPEAAIRMTMRWLHRRNQKTFVSWEDFLTRLQHHPIVSPRKRTVMKEYVVVPDRLLRKTNDLKKYFEVSFTYVASLKPKATTKKASTKTTAQKKAAKETAAKKRKR